MSNGLVSATAWTVADEQRLDATAMSARLLLAETVRARLAQSPEEPSWRALEAQLVELLDTLATITVQTNPDREPSPLSRTPLISA